MNKNTLMVFLIGNSFFNYAQKLTSFIDPFWGTGGHGHVYPGVIQTGLVDFFKK